MHLLATTGNADADIDVGELVKAEDQERLVNLETEDLRLDQAEGLAVDLDQASAVLFEDFRQHFCTTQNGHFPFLSARSNRFHHSQISTANNFDVLERDIPCLASSIRTLWREVGNFNH